ncbi:MAG: LysM peptidoglycan-binding domain-containing protein [Alphaproteobacteria bacterium]|nr:MAG: LysM peptidoglycan-binding domain-containing protein [Alphaproteobacteria bacterium]
MKIKRHALLLSTALAAWLALAGTADAVAPVINMGVGPPARNGAVTVRPGDTIEKIAKLYRLPVSSIAEMNHLRQPYRLSTGQRLLLPMPREHRVGETDTLYSISRMYGKTVAAVAAANNLKPPYTLRRGQVLHIPDANGAVTAAAAPPAAKQPARVAAKATPAAPAAATSSGHVRLLKKPGPSAFTEMVGKIAGKPKNNVTFRTSPLYCPKPGLPPPPTVSTSSRPGFVWPVRGQVISSYGPKDGGLYNDGINIAAPRGTPVVAAADGTVAYVGNTLQSYGNLVLIRHSNGMVTAYAHLHTVTVREGMKIRRGQPIGAVGSTGTVAHAQLHFEVRHGTDSIDPRQYLG